MKKDLDELLKIALEEVEKRNNKEIFTIEDLFEKTFWKSIDGNDRRSLGKIFSNYVSKNSNCSILKIQKAEYKPCIYMVKK